MAASDEPQEQEEPADPVPLEELRRFVRDLVQRYSFRQVAQEAGVGRESVRKFVEGDTPPYRSTERKFRELYVRERPLVPYGSAASRQSSTYRRAPAAPSAPRAPLPSPPDPRDNEFVRLRLASARRAFPSDAELAYVLGVDRAQPSRWRAGSTPDPQNRERIVAIDVVVELLSTWLAPTSIPKWLNGTNAHLGNRRPIAVLREGGLSEVVAAIEAEKAGAFA